MGFLDKIKGQTEAKVEANKSAAEAAEAAAKSAEAAAAAAAGRRDAVREALRISTDSFGSLAAQHKTELGQMVSKNKEAVGASLGEVNTEVDKAVEAGAEITAEDVQGAKVEAIKGSTVEGLKAKRDEMRAASALGEASGKLSQNFEAMNADEVAESEAALASGDAAVMKKINAAVGERVAAEQKAAAAAKEANLTPGERKTRTLEGLNARVQEQLKGPEATKNVESSIAAIADKLNAISNKTAALRAENTPISEEDVANLKKEVSELSNLQKVNYEVLEAIGDGAKLEYVVGSKITGGTIFAKNDRRTNTLTNPSITPRYLGDVQKINRMSQDIDKLNIVKA